jgi:lipid II:glycine glycyltransferase (peptidoglycan interpeptide bridge formation enzyme)
MTPAGSNSNNGRSSPGVEAQVDGLDAASWDALSRGFADRSLYQTWAFESVRCEETGSQLSSIVVRRASEPIGMALVRIKRLPMVRAGVAYVFRGPLWRRSGAAPAELAAVLDAIREEYAVKRGLTVRVVPNIAADDEAGDLRDALTSAGYDVDPATPAYRTFMLELLPPLDELRRGLAQKWRNGLNQSEKKGLIVEDRSDGDALREFQSLYDEMWSQKQFETGVQLSTFAAAQGALSEPDRLTISLARQDGQAVAGHVSSALGDTCIYLLGASNDAGRQAKASYLLQWHTVERAKSAGAAYYDLGGIDPAENPGVHHFKAGLGGRDCTFIGQFQSCGSVSGRVLVPLAERAYRALRAARRPS